MTKIYKKLNKFPIIFEDDKLKDCNYSPIEITSICHVYTDLKDVKDRIDHFIQHKSKIRTRMYRLHFRRGLLLIRNYEVSIIVIIYKEDGILKAYYLDEYRPENISTSITTIINKFVKAHGIKLKDLSFINREDFMKYFCIPYEIKMNDYEESFQHQISSEFIKEELSKLNTVKDE